MSVNLLEVLKGFIGKDTVSQMAGILGESTEKTESAIGSAVPALLGGFMKQASTPQGAQNLFEHLGDSDDSMLDNLGDLLGGGNSQSLLDAGGKILSGLFGGNLNSIIDLITKATGLGGKSAGSLLGLLAPIVMGVLGRQCKSGGLDAAGLGTLLLGQKDSLGSVMPKGMGDLLGLSSLGAAADQVGDAVAGAAGGVRDAASTAADSVRDVAGSAAEGARDVADAGGSLVGKVLPILAILALAFIAWRLFQPTPDVVPANGDDEYQLEIELPPDEVVTEPLNVIEEGPQE